MSIKTCHWTMFNRSGMNQVAETLCAAERALGLDSHICNIQEDKDWERFRDADIHISHTWFPDSMRKKLTKPERMVWVGHGTPEHVVHWSYQEHQKPGWGIGDSFMLTQHALRTAHAIVTFWPRHQWIYESMVPRERKVDLVPLGVNRAYWAAGASLGKFAGSPSFFTAENPHTIKWPLDLILAWPYVYRELDGACLHAMYVTLNLHRWFAPLMNANGAAYAMHWGPSVTDHHDGLRNIFKSTDFYIGLVRYGDFNCISLQANAANKCRTISYHGNPYSDFWVTEGDQRTLAKELVAIVMGDAAQREKEPVPDISETARAMLSIYERILPRMAIKPLAPEHVAAITKLRAKRARRTKVLKLPVAGPVAGLDATAGKAVG